MIFEDCGPDEVYVPPTNDNYLDLIWVITQPSPPDGYVVLRLSANGQVGWSVGPERDMPERMQYCTSDDAAFQRVSALAVLYRDDNSHYRAGLNNFRLFEEKIPEITKDKQW